MSAIPINGGTRPHTLPQETRPNTNNKQESKPAEANIKRLKEQDNSRSRPPMQKVQKEKPAFNRNNQTPGTNAANTYEGQLNNHVRNNFPGARGTGDIFKDMRIPTVMTEIRERQTEYRPRQENKPFKRQSYHVAIAYHIHIKSLRGKDDPRLDPTWAAKEMRDRANRQP